MSVAIEVLLPLRNPTEAFRATVDSLLAQTDRGFSVLLSDNHSTSGEALIAETIDSLRAAGIAVEKVRPPDELHRVEHWNWLHRQSKAEWLKPLFAGDWLEPQAIARFKEAILANPEARFAHCSYGYHEEGSPSVEQLTRGGEARFRSAEEMNDVVLRFGHQFGPPNAVLFQRDAWLAAGAFRPTLPICADSLLCCQLARRFGALDIPEVLSHFKLHGARFSMSLPGRPEAMLREKLTFLAMLVYHAWTENRPIPWFAVARLVSRDIREYLRQKRTGSLAS